MQVGGRDISRILAAPLDRGHWRALAGMRRAYPRQVLPEVLRRYLAGGGAYPWSCPVRTPLGVVTPVLDARDDLLTINEVFARRDYPVPDDLRVAVDVGANIGLASLYFLSRNADARTYCVEPDPKNTARIARTLGAMAGRWSVDEVAVTTASEPGEATFFAEPTGRYGGLDRFWKDPADAITVATRPLADILAGVLAREERIDVLKVDTEGAEAELVAAIPPAQLDRIDRIYYETDAASPVHGDRYRHRYANQVNALVRHGLTA